MRGGGEPAGQRTRRQLTVLAAKRLRIPLNISASPRSNSSSSATEHEPVVIEQLALEADAVGAHA